MMTQRLLRAATASLIVLSAPFYVAPAWAAANGQSGVSSDYAAILETRMQAIEEQMTRLTAQVEQADFQARQAQTRLQRLEEDINTRFRMIEQNGATEATSPASPAATGTATTTPTAASGNMSADERALGQLTGGGASPSTEMPGDPNTAYDQAFSKIRDGDYEAAESAMRAFIAKWPRHELASNASYWLGETFYVRGNYEQAAKAFAEAYQKYPQGPKSEDTLLKLGLTLSALNRGADACMAFDQLQADFPRLSSTSRRRVDEERSQLKCNVPASQNPQRSGSTAAGRSTHER